MNPLQHSTPKSNNSDVHELRYRISQLEHLLITSSLSTINLNNSSLPSNTTVFNTQNGFVERINDLEGLLAASELQNEKLQKQLELMTVERNRQEVHLLERLYKKDTEVKDLQLSQKLLEVKHKKSVMKVENIQEYLNKLPSQDELDEAKALILKYQEENQLLEGKLLRLTSNFHALQKDKAAAEAGRHQAEQRLEELKPLEDAHAAISNEIYFNGDDETPETSKMLLTLTSQRAQLLRSTKIIDGLRDKHFQNETEKAEYLIKITNLESDIESLQEQLLTVQLNLEKAADNSRILTEEKINLQTDNTNLRNQLELRDNYLKQKDDNMRNTMNLITEIDMCVNEVEKLTEIGCSIARGEDPSMTALLGLNDDLENHIQSLSTTTDKSVFCSDDITITSDAEWTFDRHFKIRELRKTLNDLRDIVGDLYSDMLCGKMEGCKVQ